MWFATPSGVPDGLQPPALGVAIPLRGYVVCNLGEVLGFPFLGLWSRNPLTGLCRLQPLVMTFIRQRPTKVVAIPLRGYAVCNPWKVYAKAVDTMQGRNPLTGLCGLQPGGLRPAARPFSATCRNPLTGLCGLQRIIPEEEFEAYGLGCRNPLTGLCGLQPRDRRPVQPCCR